jgi:hypothetical protein
MPVKVRRRPGPLPANGGELAGENESRAVGRPIRRSGRLRSTLPSFRKRRWVTAPQGESGQSPLGGFGAPEPKESSAGQQSLVSVGNRPVPVRRYFRCLAAEQSLTALMKQSRCSRRAWRTNQPITQEISGRSAADVRRRSAQASLLSCLGETMWSASILRPRTRRTSKTCRLRR